MNSIEFPYLGLKFAISDLFVTMHLNSWLRDGHQTPCFIFDMTWHAVCQHHGHRWFGYVSMRLYPHDTRGESQRFTTKPRMVEWIWPLGATWNRWILPPQRMYPDVLKVASQWYRGKNTYELPHLPSVQHPCARTNYTRFSVGNFVLHGL